MSKKKPTLPCIALSTKLVKTDDDPLISKIDSMPYIDSNLEYPKRDDKPMICVAQLNMDHIFGLLKNKKSDTKIRKYFKQYPQTGLIQIYLPDMEELTDNEDDVYIRYIAEYDISNHDTKKQKKIQKIYSRYRKMKGSIFNFPYNKEYYAYITDATYAYDFINWTMQNHPDWDENMEGSEQKYMTPFNEQDNDDNHICLGGFPYHLQDDFDFDENEYVMLLSLINGVMGLNIAIPKDKIVNLEFDDVLFDLSYD